MIQVQIPREGQTVADHLFRYAVIVARYNHRWVYCQHRERTTWELPGGRREPGEAIADTAHRELYEETGATQYSLLEIGPYCVNRDGAASYGMLYYAEIEELGELPPTEIERVVLLHNPPAHMEYLTYPDIQPVLLRHAVQQVGLAVHA